MQRYKKSAKSKTEQVKNLRHLRNLRDLSKINLRKNKKPQKSFEISGFDKRRRLPTLPHCIAVPSAQVSLTSLFGMGRGGTSPQ